MLSKYEMAEHLEKEKCLVREQQPNEPNIIETGPPKRVDFWLPIKYCNTLPDVPLDPKFLKYRMPREERFLYCPTALERNPCYDVHVERDIGLDVNLVNLDLYKINSLDKLHATDSILINDELNARYAMRTSAHSKRVSWLRRSEYISSEKTRFNRLSAVNPESRLGHNIKEDLMKETLVMDRALQVNCIEKTFTDSKETIYNHYSKPNVTAVEVIPLFPDCENWKYSFAQVDFDAAPDTNCASRSSQIDKMSQAHIRGLKDINDEQLVAYFVPTDETQQKYSRDKSSGLLYTPNQEYEYRMTREYNWNVKNKHTEGYDENFFFVLKSDCYYYNELETRVLLSRRRHQTIFQRNNVPKLLVKHVPFRDVDFRIQRYRSSMFRRHGNAYAVATANDIESLPSDDEDFDIVADNNSHPFETADNGLNESTGMTSNEDMSYISDLYSTLPSPPVPSMENSINYSEDRSNVSAIIQAVQHDIERLRLTNSCVSMPSFAGESSTGNSDDDASSIALKSESDAEEVPGAI